jgi:hypothetical protein
LAEQVSTCSSPIASPLSKPKTSYVSLSEPSFLLILTFLQLPIPSPPLPQPPPTPSESQFDTDPQPNARHIPTPINTFLTAVGLPGVDTPKITPEDKIVEKAPESYGPLAPGGKGLEIHEDVGKQRVFDGVEAERLAGMEEKEGEKREEEGEGERSSGCSQRGPSRLGRQTAGGEVVAPEPEPVMDEEVETDRDEFESMAGDGEDVELGDEKSWLGAFEDEYL